MTEHMWVAIQYTPIEIDEAEDGTLHTFTREGADELAREESAIGCYICGTPLNTNTYKGECAGQNILAGDLDTA